MILKKNTETLLEAIERKGREMSVAPIFVVAPEVTFVDVYELIGALAGEVRYLRQRLDEIQRAAVAHCGDTVAHPCSNNAAIPILRALVNEGEEQKG